LEKWSLTEIVQFLEKNMERIQERYPHIVIARLEPVPLSGKAIQELTETLDSSQDSE
jgi:hypothetical protein